jgi:hypothetical protein
MGVPPDHTFLDGIFHGKKSTFGYPHGFWETTIFIISTIGDGLFMSLPPES